MATRQKTGSIHWGEKSRDEGGFVFQTLFLSRSGAHCLSWQGHALGWGDQATLNSQVVTGTETQGTALGQQSDPRESWNEGGSGKVPTAKSWVEVGKVGGSSPTFIQN